MGQVAPRRRYINLIRETGRAKARYKSNRGTRHVSFTARTAAQTAAQAGGSRGPGGTAKAEYKSNIRETGRAYLVLTGTAGFYSLSVHYALRLCMK